MHFGMLDIVIVHLLGMFIGLYIAPRLLPSWGKDAENIDKDMDDAVAIANGIDPASKTK